LRDQPDAPPQRQWVEVGDIVAAKEHPAATGYLEAVAQAQQRRLPRPGRPDDTGDTLVGDVAGQVDDEGALGAVDGDVLEAEEDADDAIIPPLDAR
jgi:hypothetical protein